MNTFIYQGHTHTIYKRKRDQDRPSAPWYFKVDNKPRSLQTSDKAQAIANAKTRLAQRAGTDKYQAFLDETAQRQTRTLAPIVKEWIHLGCPSPTGARRTASQQADQKSHIIRALKWWGSKSPAAVKLPTMNQYAAWRRNTVTKGTGDRSIDLELTTLSNCCKWAASHGHLDANPFEARPRFHNSRNVQHCHLFAPESDEELHSIARWMITQDSLTTQIAGAQFMFQALTGLRPGEPCHLRINPEKLHGRPAPGAIFTRHVEGVPTDYIAVHRQKNGFNPAVKIHPALAEFIRHWRAFRDQNFPANPYWFPHPTLASEPLPTNRGTSTMSRALGAATEALGLTERHAHGGRAYYVRVRRSQGIEDATIALELGQRNGQALIESTYGDPRDILGDNLCDWIPTDPVQPAWAEWSEATASNITPITQAA